MPSRRSKRIAVWVFRRIATERAWRNSPTNVRADPDQVRLDRVGPDVRQRNAGHHEDSGEDAQQFDQAEATLTHDDLQGGLGDEGT